MTPGKLGGGAEGIANGFGTPVDEIGSGEGELLLPLLAIVAEYGYGYDDSSSGA
jgi:hypothetical protein